ncbi:hypothetical protein [Luteibacter sp.]
MLYALVARSSEPCFVFSSLAKPDVQGEIYYYVRVICDPLQP